MTSPLQRQGLKQTPARIAVLSILQEQNRPMDVAEILELVRSEGIETNQATVYRILDIFCEKGMVNRFEFHEGKFRYELAGADHHHLLCESCGRIEDLSDCNIPDWEVEITRKKGFLVKRHSLEFFGLCQNCQR
jgi:Fur family transcriptional regulator, ferric uptake regulator